MWIEKYIYFAQMCVDLFVFSICIIRYHIFVLYVIIWYTIFNIFNNISTVKRCSYNHPTQSRTMGHPGQQTSRTSDIQDIRYPGHQTSRTGNFWPKNGFEKTVLDVWCPGCLMSWMSDVLDVWCPGCLMSRMSDVLDVWCPGCLMSWMSDVPDVLCHYLDHGAHLSLMILFL